MSGVLLQPKLSVGSPGDRHEEEADRVAEQVMTTGTVAQPIGAVAPLVQHQVDSPTEPTVVTVAAGAASSRSSTAIGPGADAAAAATDDETSATSEAGGTPASGAPAQLGPHDEIVVMAKEQPGHAPRDRVGLEDQLASTRGGGESLPAGERSFFEARFGESFGNVRIHADGDAAGMTAELGARAFTHGRDVYFGAGEYQPGSEGGRHLLAHELTHVVQQTRGGAQGSVQRQSKDKPRPAGYTVRVPASHVGRPQEFLAIALAQAFTVPVARAREIISKEGWHWEGGWGGPSADDVKLGYVDVNFETERYRETQDKLKPVGKREPGGRLQGAAARESAMQQLPAGEQVAINREANRQFWARARYKIGQGYNITELVGEIGEALARESLRAGAAPGQVVLSNIEIVREVPGFKTIAEWKAAEQAAGRPGDVGGLYEADGKLWKSITEVDNMVVERGGNGKLRIADLEQTKVGGTHAAATAQNAKAMAGLSEIAAGKTDVQIFDRTGKNKLGAQRTGEFDLSSLAGTGQHTRGLPGSGFDRKLPFEKTTLEQLARQLLIEGLPEVWQPPLVVPPTGDRTSNRGERP